MEEGTETDQVTLWEALKAQQPDMDQDLQRYIFLNFQNNFVKSLFKYMYFRIFLQGYSRKSFGISTKHF